MPPQNLRRDQLGKLSMYGLAFFVGFWTGTIYSGVLGGLAFVGLFAVADTALEFAFGCLGDYRERRAAASGPGAAPARTRREARRAARAVRSSPAEADSPADETTSPASSAAASLAQVSPRHPPTPPRRRRRR